MPPDPWTRPPRIRLRDIAGSAVLALAIWLWLSAAAILEEVLF